MSYLGIIKKGRFSENTADRNLNCYFLEDELTINIISEVVILCSLIHSKEIILEIVQDLAISVLISDCVHYSSREREHKKVHKQVNH